MKETAAPAPVRRRPRDRRQAIEASAALAFAERGYHEVSMQDVADAVGITAAALYRHFDNKYELFRSVALGLVEALVEAVDEVAAFSGDDAAARSAVDELLGALTAATIPMRATGGIYRWESRYLRVEDRHALRDAFGGLRARLAVPVAAMRPALSGEALDLATLAALSVIASVTTHRAAMPAPALRALLDDAAVRVLLASPSEVPPLGDDAAPEPVAPRRRRDQLAQAGIELFAARGYHDVTIEDIATAVGLTPSGVYRHFGGKAEILLTACQRAAASLDGAAEEALGHAESREALVILEEAYIRFAVEHRDLMDVYAADVGALDVEDQKRLRRMQRAHVDDWVELLTRVRPEVEAREARFLVHAGFNVVADLSVALRWRSAADAKEWIRPVLEAVLGVSSQG